MLRTLVLGSILLLALVPAMPGAAAIDPCDRQTTCPLVYVGDDWACAGLRHQYESGGVCAEADPACVSSGWGRAQETTCVADYAQTPSCKPACDIVRIDDGRVCVAFKPEVDGPMVCAAPKTACASAYIGVVREQVCVSDLGQYLP